MIGYDPRRADARPIEEKALGLIYAMDDAAAARLRSKLDEMAKHKGAGGQRAAMFCGKIEEGAAK